MNGSLTENVQQQAKDLFKRISAKYQSENGKIDEGAELSQE